MPKIDATDKRSFDPLPEGEYTFVIAKASNEVSENSHNSYVHLQLQEPNTKKNVFENLVFTKGSAWKISNFWRALGHNVKKGDSIEFEAADVQGQEIKAYVSIREWNGNLQNEVDYFIEPDEAELRKPAAPVPPKSSKAVQPF